MTIDDENYANEMAKRVLRVEERIAAACTSARRDRSSVQLLAVSKGHGPERIQAAVDAGLHVFGENKVQEARAKIPLAPHNSQWHLIGHLQTNKIKFAVQLFDTVHSVDSLKLLRALNQGAEAAGVNLSVLLEVNVSGEASKYGLTPDAVPEVLEAAAQCFALDVVGLMTIPPFTEDPEGARPHFVRLRTLRDEWRESTGFPLEELSMGMSHDLEVAIEEGATWVRVGTDLFGKR